MTKKDRKSKKGEKALIGRVKKAIKKSRRQLNDERFRKELQRTIRFLEGIKSKINHGPVMPKKSAKTQQAPASKAAAAAKPKPRAGAKPGRKAGRK